MPQEGKKISELQVIEQIDDNDLLMVVEVDETGNPLLTRSTTIQQFKSQVTNTNDSYLKGETYTKGETEDTIVSYLGIDGELYGYRKNKWNEAYGWGDHSTFGYEYANQKDVANGYAPIDNNRNVPLNNLGNAVKVTHPVNDVTQIQITSWDTAYGWGDHSTFGYEYANQKGVANGYCPLDADTLIPTKYLPALAITTTRMFNTTSLRDGWTDKQEGDVAIVGTADTNMTSYIWNGSNWIELETSGWVNSVNGYKGAVTLDYTDVNALPDTHDAKNITNSKISKWDNMLSTGNDYHGDAGYAFSNSLSSVATSGSYDDLADKPVNVTTTVDGYMSSTDKSKLNGIASGADANVQSDWNATSGDAFIKNKPDLSSVATSGSYDDLADKPVNVTTTVDGYMSANDKKKLDSVSSDADANVQSDWNATSGDAFIKNKPDLSSVGGIADVLKKSIPISGDILADIFAKSVDGITGSYNSHMIFTGSTEFEYCGGDGVLKIRSLVYGPGASGSDAWAKTTVYLNDNEISSIQRNNHEGTSYSSYIDINVKTGDIIKVVGEHRKYYIYEGPSNYTYTTKHYCLVYTNNISDKYLFVMRKQII